MISTGTLGKKHGKKCGAGGKFAVVGAVERKGKVVARVLDAVTPHTLKSFVSQTWSDRR